MAGAQDAPVQDALIRLGSVRSVTVLRDGDRDLTFQGYLLGRGVRRAVNGEWEVIVRLWLVEGSHRYVVSVERHRGSTVRDTAAVCDSAAEVLAWLKQDSGRSRLGSAAKEAWDEACSLWPPLADARTERIS